MRRWLAVTALVLVGCGSKSEPSASALRGPSWRFHVTADEGVMRVANVRDRLFVGELRSRSHQFVDSAVRVFRPGGEEPPFVFSETMGSHVLARDGSTMLLAWRARWPVDKISFVVLDGPDRQPWSIDVPRGGAPLAAVGIGSAWIVCAMPSAGGVACARVERGKVGPWHEQADVAGDRRLTLVAHEGGPLLIAACTSAMMAMCDRGSDVVRLDLDGQRVAIRHVEGAIVDHAMLHDTLLVKVLGPITHQAIRATDLAVVPIKVPNGELTEAPGGVWIVDRDKLLLWNGKDPPTEIATKLEGQLLAPGRPSDLAVRTEPNGLLYAWRLANPEHDGDQDVTVWSPEPP